MSHSIAAVVLTVSHTSGLTSSPVSIPIQLEMIAIVTSSIYGVIAARERHLDLVGSVGLAVACALGGGLLRDMILQVGDVYILEQPLALPLSVGTSIVAFVFHDPIARQDRLLAMLDIFAVGLYSATGADKALVYGFGPMIGIMMGFFTGVGGGLLRDVCLGGVPHIFQQGNLYAIASIAGSGAYVALIETGASSNVLALAVCVLVTMGLRWLSLRYDIKSPTEVDLSQVAEPIKHLGKESKRRARKDGRASGGPRR